MQEIELTPTRIPDERIDWQDICTQHEPRGLQKAAIAAEQLPIMDHAKRVLITSSVVLIGFLALIWTVVHFAPIIDTWPIPAWFKVLSISVMVALIVASRIKRGAKW